MNEVVTRRDKVDVKLVVSSETKKSWKKEKFSTCDKGIIKQENYGIKMRLVHHLLKLTKVLE